jgi:hypothetical protein
MADQVWLGGISGCIRFVSDSVRFPFPEDEKPFVKDSKHIENVP